MNVKEEQLKISLEQEWELKNGLDEVKFTHYALPELNFNEISTKVKFLGRIFSQPVMIGSMTGGTERTGKINEKLAAAAEEKNIPFSTGSHKIALKKPEVFESFNVKRKNPDVFLIANLGGTALLEFDFEEIERSLERIEADAVFIHLNPLQELMQKDGNKKWKGVREKIAELCDYLSIPVLAKEVGNGINGKTALELQKAGVKAIDLAGFGGTNWGEIEKKRNGETRNVFKNWGVSTLQSLKECRNLKTPIIASGGIRNGLEVAKTIRLGATLASASLPFLKAVVEDRLEKELDEWLKELKIAMMLTRSSNLNELRKAEIQENRSLR